MVFGGWGARRLGFRTRRYAGRKNKKGKKLATVSLVKKIANATHEKKFIIVSNASLTTTLTQSVPSLTLLNALVQGNTDNTRIGDRVRFIKLEMDLIVYPPAQVDDTTYKIEVIRVREPRGVAPTFTQLYNTSGPSPIDHHNHINVDWNARFECVYSSMHSVHPRFSTNTPSFHVPIHISLKKRITDYSISNVGTIADIDRNAYYLAITTESGNAVTIFYAYYLYYYDM